MSPRRRLDRVGLLLLGLLAGIVLSALSLYWFVDRSRTRQVEERVQVALGLPDEAFELEDVEEDGSLRIVLRQVAFLDKAGDTIVSAPAARGRLVARTLSADDGPIVIDQVVLERPTMRLLQRASGDWNFFDIIKAEAAGAPLTVPEEEQSRPIAFQGMRVTDGTVRIATPYAAPPNPPTGRLAARQPERVRSGGRTYTVRWMRNVDATLPLVRIGPNGGWRAEVAALTADVTNPDTRVQQLAGWFESDPDKTLRFDIDAFRTPRSSFDGEGRVRFADAGPVFDLNVRANPLSFADLQGMGFPIPAAGTASFALRARSQEGGRTLWRMTDASVAILDSRASGRLTVLTGPDAEPVFSDTRISLDPLVLTNLEELGYVEPLPLVGTVRGEIASLDVLQAGQGGPLRLDLTASLTPRNQTGGAPSVVAAAGLVRWTPNAESMVAFSGLRVEARPLRLEHLAALQEKPAAWMRGTLTGVATVSGTPADLRLEDGDLTYAVGDAPETVLRGLAGRFQGGTTPRWEFSARAQPLALATLTELFPALPFRTATLSGPITASGVGDDVRFDVDLAGAAGGVAMAGTLRLGDPLRFDVSGRLDAFRTAGVLAGDVPLDGPLSGTFSARGAANDFRFAVDMRQGGGSFNLAGNVRRAGTDPYQFDVAGRVDNFRIGALIGQPGLLPGPVSGPIAVSGGGRQPYRFDVALTGPQGMFDVEGFFRPGTVPTYAVSGRIQGLDLSALPGMANLPDTRLTGTIDIDGRGTTPETFSGRIAFDAAPGSTVGGVPIEVGTVRLTAAEGILRIQSPHPGRARRAAGGVRRAGIDVPRARGAALYPGRAQPGRAGRHPSPAGRVRAGDRGLAAGQRLGGRHPPLPGGGRQRPGERIALADVRGRPAGVRRAAAEGPEHLDGEPEPERGGAGAGQTDLPRHRPGGQPGPRGGLVRHRPAQGRQHRPAGQRHPGAGRPHPHGRAAARHGPAPARRALDAGRARGAAGPRGRRRGRAEPAAGARRRRHGLHRGQRHAAHVGERGPGRARGRHQLGGAAAADAHAAGAGRHPGPGRQHRRAP